MSKTYENFKYDDHDLSTDVEQGTSETAIPERLVTLGQPKAWVIGTNVLELVASTDTSRIRTEAEIAALRTPELPLPPYEK